MLAKGYNHKKMDVAILAQNSYIIIKQMYYDKEDSNKIDERYLGSSKEV